MTEEGDIDSADVNVNENASEEEEESEKDSDKEEEESDSSEILFKEVDKEIEDSDDEEESKDSMSSSLNCRRSGGRERSGRSVRTSRPTHNQPLTYTVNGIIL